MTSIIRGCFGNPKDVFRTNVEIIRPRDFFHFGKKPKIIYVAYQGQDDQGNPQMRKRVVYHATNKKRIGKTSKIPESGDCLIALHPPKCVVLSCLKKGDSFIVLSDGKYTKATYCPVGIVNRKSNTSKWRIELLHCQEKYVKMNKSNMVIPL